jgi:hypothetical protein
MICVCQGRPDAKARRQEKEMKTQVVAEEAAAAKRRGKGGNRGGLIENQ